MATITVSYPFLSGLETWVASGGQSGMTQAWDGTQGNPLGSLKTRVTGKNTTFSAADWRLESTWEALGVPVGATVTAIRLSAASYKCIEWNTGVSATEGPWELRDTAGVNLATLAAGVAYSAVHATWQSASGTDQAVPTSHQASNSSIRLIVGGTMRTGNSTAAAVTMLDDELSFVITYTPAAANDSLTGANLTGGTPTLSTPTLGVVHALTAAVLTGGTPTLSTPTAADIPPFTGYEIERKAGVGGTWGSLATDDASPYTDTGPFTDAVTYYYRVRYVTAGTPGTWSNEASVVYAGGADHNLTATSITAGVPTLSTPTLTGLHVLTADAVATGAPTLSTPALSQIHVLTGDAVATGAPTLSSPGLFESNDLTALGIDTGAPTVGTATISQVHILAGASVAAGAPTLAAGAISQHHALAAAALSAGAPTLSAPSMSGLAELAGLSVTAGAPTLSTPSLSQAHSLASTGVTAGPPTLSTPAIGQVHALNGAALTTGTPTLSAAILSAGYAGTTYYIKPAGSDIANGLTEANAWATFAHAWAVLDPGDTLIVMDGTYTQSIIPSSCQGTASSPITISAANDGAAIIDGEGVRTTLELQGWTGGNYFIIEGIVARNSSAIVYYLNGTTGTIIRRCSGRDANDDGNNHVFSVYQGSGNLLEDCVASGRGRKMFMLYRTNGNTLRRCFARWERWDGRDWADNWPWGENIDVYNSYNNIVENCIAWGVETATISASNSEGISSVPRYNFTLRNNSTDPSILCDDNQLLGCMSLYANMGHSASDPTNTSLMSSTDWPTFRPEPTTYDANMVDPNAIDSYKVGLEFYGIAGSSLDGNIIRDFFAAYNGSYGINLASGAEPTTTTLDYITLHDNCRQTTDPSIGGVGTDILQADLTELGGATNSDIADIYNASTTTHSSQSGTGARLTNRYVDGTLTSTALWPWPMNARILSETGVDVTTEMAAILFPTMQAVSIDAGAPTLSTPAIGQAHVLSAGSMAAGTPALSLGTLAQLHALTAAALTTGAPTLGTPSIAEAGTLLAIGIDTGAPILSAPAPSQHHALTTLSLTTGAAFVGSGALTQQHALTAIPRSTGVPTLSTPDLVALSGLVALPVTTGVPTLSTPAIGQVHALSGVAVETTPVLSGPDISQLHVLTALALAAGIPVPSNPSLFEGVVRAPPSRTMTVRSEDRRLEVPAETRRFLVAL